VTRPSRRAVLRGAVRSVVAAAAASVTVGLMGSTAACGRDRNEPDPLEAPLASARADAALAASGAALPELAARLSTVADARRAHADALADEIRRARPDRTGVVDAPAPPPAPLSGAAETLRAVRDALGAARDAGAGLALAGTRYRGGLLASIAASCAGLQETLA